MDTSSSAPQVPKSTKHTKWYIYGGVIAILLATLATVIIYNLPIQSTEITIPKPTPKPLLDVSKVQLTVEGPEETILSVNQYGLQHSPEGKINYIKNKDTYDVWFGAGNKGYLFTSPDMKTLTPGNGVTNNVANPVLTPGLAGVDPGYAGFGSVVQAGNGTLLAIYHTEDYNWEKDGNQPSKYWAQIALARSTDGGKNWEKLGAIITGRDPKPASPTRAANGAGMPVAITKGAYLYVLYTDWRTTQGKATGADQIHVARVKLSEATKPEAWKKFFDGSFTQPARGGDSTAVIPRSDAAKDSGYTSLGSVSYNTELGAYLAIINSNDGIYFSTSPDLERWTEVKKFYNYPVMYSALKRGDPWYLYPSYISPSEIDDRHTTKEGYLYFGKATSELAPHTLTRMKMTVTKST